MLNKDEGNLLLVSALVCIPMLLLQGILLAPPASPLTLLLVMTTTLTGFALLLFLTHSVRRGERARQEQRWLHPNFEVALFRDDCEGYYLNYTTDAPCWFVLWRMDEGQDFARPVAVSLSYHDAGRWLDAQETCEQVPAPPEIVAWVREFAEAHYVPEPRKRKRPESFRRLEDRFGNPASVSTGKKFGGGDA